MAFRNCMSFQIPHSLEKGLGGRWGRRAEGKVEERWWRAHRSSYLSALHLWGGGKREGSGDIP